MNILPVLRVTCSNCGAETKDTRTFGDYNDPDKATVFCTKCHTRVTKLLEDIFKEANNE